MFPTANSVVHYNEYGEPTGWDTYREEDPFDYYDESVNLYGYDEDIDPEDCAHKNVGWISSAPSGTYGTCDNCGSEVKEDAAGRWELT